MKAQHKRRALGTTVGAVLVVAAGIIAFSVIGDDSGNGANTTPESNLTTTLIEERSLTEYLEIAGTLDYEGTVALAAHSGGVLMQLAPEGTVARQGEQLYLILDEPTDADTASVLAEFASAKNSLVDAEGQLSEAASGPSESEIASARAAVAAASDARGRLVERPSAAEVASAEAAVLAAIEDLEALDNPTAASLAGARSQIATAKADLADLLASAPEAEIDAARAAVQAANEHLTDLMAGATEADIQAARAARATAWEAHRDRLQYSDSEAEIDESRADLLLAEQALADLLAGASEAEIDSARADLSVAEQALADLLAEPSEADIENAEANVLAAVESLHLLESPTDAVYAQKRADLATARQARTDLLADPSAAEIEDADAAILVAKQALDDLLTEPSADEIAALEAMVSGAAAALRSAETDTDALNDVHNSLLVMYGSTPVYRTMQLGTEGDDVRQLEQNLADLGYGDDDAFEVDGLFDDATAAAVRRWQQANGHNVDAAVGTSDVVFVAGPVQVGGWDQAIELGQTLEIGRTLASLTVIETPAGGELSTTQRVVANLPLSDRDLISVGIAVNVELPDDTDVAGTVTVINPSPVTDDQTGDNVVEITILLREPVSAVWIGASVDVEITETLIEDALVVPATALLALVEGGSAVEILAEDGSVRLVGVDTGLFVDGDVEVIGPELAAGMRVVVPR